MVAKWLILLNAIVGIMVALYGCMNQSINIVLPVSIFACVLIGLAEAWGEAKDVPNQGELCTGAEWHADSMQHIETLNIRNSYNCRA